MFVAEADVGGGGELSSANARAESMCGRGTRNRARACTRRRPSARDVTNRVREPLAAPARSAGLRLREKTIVAHRACGAERLAERGGYHHCVWQSQTYQPLEAW